MKKRDVREFIRHAVIYVLVLNMATYLPISTAGAAPQGAEVVNGTATIAQSGNNTVINASNKAIINYRSFDIAKPETVQFIQPSSSASVLNRIQSASPTTIDGMLIANGRVFFVNPAGVIIGQGAIINVNQLVASGLNMSDTSFLSGKYEFSGGNGSVINKGDITALKVYLIGKQVANSGNIICPQGYVVLAVGNRVLLSENGSDIAVVVESDSSGQQGNTLPQGSIGVSNEGSVKAEGGSVFLASAGDIYSKAINNSGEISVSSSQGAAGKVNFQADGGSIENSGDVTANSGTSKGGAISANVAEFINTGALSADGTKGGSITIDATSRVGQFGLATANGNEGGGGSVRLQAGTVIVLSKDSVTSANAGLNGDGGTVEVISPGSAMFRTGARIEAKGGSESGNGGFADVSGKQYVELGGSIDLTAPHGETGTFLIDPYDLTIVDDALIDDVDPDGGIWTANAPDSRLRIGTLESYLDSSNVTLSTFSPNGDEEGNVTFAATRVVGSGTANDESNSNSLTVKAYGSIIMNSGSGIDFQGSGDVTLNARGNITLGESVSTNGSIHVVSGKDGTLPDTEPRISGKYVVVADGKSLTAGGALGADATGDLTLGGATTSGGNMALAAGQNLTANSAVSAGGTLAATATGGGLTLNGPVTAAGDMTLTAGGALTANGVVSTTSGDIEMMGHGGINLNGDVTAAGSLAVNDTMDAGSSLTATGGSVTVAGGSVAGNITGDGVTLNGAVTADGAGVQSLDARAGKLWAKSTITKTTSGDLALAGDNLVQVDGAVAVNAGSLAVNDTMDAGSSLTATGGSVTVAGGSVAGNITGDGVTLNGAVTADGAGVQSLDARAGKLWAKSTITKTTSGDLALAGDNLVQVDGAVAVNAGSLAVNDTMDAGSSLTATGGSVTVAGGSVAGNITGDGVTLNGAVTADGAGVQSLDARAGKLWAKSTITKTTSGDLALAGDNLVQVDGAVAVNAGSLAVNDTMDAGSSLTATGGSVTVAGGSVAGNITGDGVTLNGAVTADGAGVQSLDARAGKLWAKSTITKTTSGDLALAGDNLVQVDGAVAVNAGSLAVNDTMDAGSSLTATGGSVTVAGGSVAGNITGDGVTLNGAVTADGAGVQSLDARAGKLWAKSTITKTTSGDLALAGDNLVQVDGAVAVNAGSLAVNDTMDAGSSLTATGGSVTVAGGSVAGNITGDGVTLNGAVTADGTGVQSLDARAGKLWAKSTITKTTSGDLALAGDNLVQVDGAVAVNAGSLAVNDTMDAGSSLTATGGSVTVAGGSVAGNITGDGVTLNGAVTADGAGVQSLDARAGKLWAKSTITKTTSGDLALAGDNLVQVDGAVAVNAGSLAVNDTMDAGSSLTATGGSVTVAGGSVAGNITGDGVTLNGAVTADGAGVQSLDARAGKLWAKSTITKTTSGDLALAGDNLVQVDGAVAVNAGSLAVNDTMDAGSSLTATGGSVTVAGGSVAGNITGDGVTLNGAVTADGAGVQSLDARAGKLWAKSTITKTTSGDLALAGDNLVQVDGAVAVNAGSLAVNDTMDAGSSLTATGGSVTVAGGSVAGNITGDGVTLNGAVTADGAGVQSLDARAGKLWAKSTITKTTSGDLALAGDNLVQVDGAVAVNAGSLAVNDTMDAGSSLTATGGSVTVAGGSVAGNITGDGVTLNGAVTADGAGVQSLDARAGKLWAKSTITKTTSGDLALAGDNLVQVDGAVAVNAGSLAVNDTMDAGSSLTATGGSVTVAGGSVAGNITGDGVTLNGAVTADGAGVQSLDARAGKLWAKSTITKTTSGDLALAGDNLVQVDGAVAVNAGSLAVNDTMDAGSSLTATGGSVTVAGGSVAGNITGDGVTLNGAVTADGAGVQSLDARAGKLWAKSTITKTTSGDLALAGDNLVQVDGAVAVNAGSLAVNDTMDAGSSLTATGGSVTVAGGSVAGNITGDGVTLNGAVTADGAGVQSLDARAGKLWAKSTITKTTSGDLALAGDNLVQVDGAVAVNAGSLAVNDTMDAGSSLTATGGSVTVAGGSVAGNITGDGVTLNGAVTADGAGVQSLDARAGKLWAKSTITKTTSGDLALAGDNLVQVDGAVAVNAGSLAVNDTMDAGSSLTATGGSVTVAGGSVAGNITGDGVTLNGAVTADGAGVQSLDARAGKLWAKSTITKTTSGDLALAGDNLVQVDGAVAVNAGSLAVNDTMDAGSSLTATGGSVTVAGGSVAGNITGDGVTLNGAVTADGAGVQSLDARAGKLWAKSTITKTTSGDLALAGDNLVQVDGAVAVNAGSLVLSDDTTVEAGLTLSASQDITFADNKILTAQGNLAMTATNGGIGGTGSGLVNITMAAAGSTLTMTQANSVQLDGFTVDGSESTHLVAESTGGEIAADSTASKWGTIEAKALGGDITLRGDGKIHIVKAESTNGGIMISSTANAIVVDGELRASGDNGNVIVEAAQDIALDGTVTATNGGVKLVSSGGKIYTPGAADSSLNVAVTGYSDDATGKGVSLPFGSQKAAIVIQSHEDFNLGSSGLLTADGKYYSPETPDNRADVVFKNEGLGAGEPIDVAVYVGNTGDKPLASIHIDGEISVTRSTNTPGPYGAIVLDAQERVTFGQTFKNWLKGKNVDWLEVCSRNVLSGGRNEVILGHKESGWQILLPYAENLNPVSSWFNYGYVLRGDRSGSVLASTEGAIVLAMTMPISIVVPLGFTPEKSQQDITENKEATELLLELFGSSGQYVLDDNGRMDMQATDVAVPNYVANRLVDLDRILANEEAAKAFSNNHDIIMSNAPMSLELQARLAATPQSEWELTSQWYAALVEAKSLMHDKIGWPASVVKKIVVDRYCKNMSATAKDAVGNYINPPATSL